jgi:hypothetical protein
MNAVRSSGETEPSAPSRSDEEEPSHVTLVAFAVAPPLEREVSRCTAEDAKEAIGHGLPAKRSKSGAVGFDPLEMEDAGASLQ